MFFALFLMSGYFKEAFNLSVNLTFVFFVMSIGIAFLRLYKHWIYSKKHNITVLINKKVLLHSLLFITFLCIILISNFYTTSINYSLEKTLKFSTITAWAFFGVYFLITNKKGLKDFLKSLATIALAMSIYSVIGLGEVAGAKSGFISVAGDNYLGLGRATGLGAIILILLYMTKKTNVLMKMVIILSVLIILFALFSSGSRMPLLSFIFVFFSAFVFSVKVKNGMIYLRKGFKTLSFFSIIGIVSFIGLASTGVFDTVIRRIGILFTETSGGTSAEGRIERYQIAYEVWKNNPILGTGIGSFPIHYKGIDIVDYPHNIFLELLSEMGLVGLLLFTILILYPVLNLVRNRNRLVFLNPENLTVLFCFLFLFLNANITGDINDNRLLFTFTSLTLSTTLIYKGNSI